MVRNVNQDSLKTLSKAFASLFLGLLVVVWPSTLLALAPDPDLNNDGTVNILDMSIVGSCFGADLSANPLCLCADTDDSGIIDMTDVNFVTEAFGQSGFPVDRTPVKPPIENPLPMRAQIRPWELVTRWRWMGVGRVMWMAIR